MICRASKRGQPISVSEFEEYVFGIVLLNDWSARDLQRFETEWLTTTSAAYMKLCAPRLRSRLEWIERVWSIGDLLDTVLPLDPNRPVRITRNFTVIDGGKR
ncbi:fumarylacetoacetate hydrolase family protein [Bradyrhizobium sp. USDA 4454]